MVISIREASKHLPISYYSLLNWSKDPSSPFYPTFLRIGNKICVDLKRFKTTAYRENKKRTKEVQ